MNNRTVTINDSGNPLVSIILHNTNDKYLRQCFDSILNQTYDNIEICFYDFASSGHSLDIALEYQQKYPGIITIHHTRENYFLELHAEHIRVSCGKYFMRFNSWCEMEPDLVEKCVKAFATRSNIAFVNIRRLMINDSGEKIPEPPLYNSSCTLFGRDHIPNLLTNASPNLISMYNSDIFATTKINSDYEAQVVMSNNYNMHYLAEPLFLYRENSTEKNSIFRKMLRIYNFKLSYSRNLNFIFDKQKVNHILSESLRKQSEKCLEYSVNTLVGGDDATAKKWFHLSVVIDETIEKNILFEMLRNYWISEKKNKEVIMEQLMSSLL